MGGEEGGGGVKGSDHIPSAVVRIADVEVTAKNSVYGFKGIDKTG